MSEENKEPMESVSLEEETTNETADQDCTQDVIDESAFSPDNSELFGGEETAMDNEEKAKKPPRRVSLFTTLCSCIAICLAAVMLTYTFCNSAYQKKLADAKLETVVTGTPAPTPSQFEELELLQRLFEAYSFMELDQDAMMTAVLKAYVHATGDLYAEYYTLEEYKQLNSDMAGENQGIGINVINSSVTVGGNEYKAFKVINVMKDSPAEKGGVKVGDFVIASGTLDEYTLFNEVSYDKALTMLQGVKGTTAEFLAYCYDGVEYKLTEFSIMREEFTSASVMSGIADASVDPTGKTGIVKIMQFDATTATQFEAAVDGLIAKGCEKFVFDVRYNPGGELTSIVSVLSYFLNTDDVVISTRDNKGNESITKVKAVDYEDTLKSDVAEEDIGKYRGLDCVVLCNEYTASAAELFVANFRDHGIGKVVGVTTYGKGSMQSYVSLTRYGYNGVLKLTCYMYYPPCGESYDGLGIEPHHVVELSDEASKLNIYDIFGTDKDNQLTEAVKLFENTENN